MDIISSYQCAKESTCSGFIEHHELGPSAHGDGHGELSALAAGELSAEVVQALAQVEEAAVVVCLAQGLLEGCALQLCEEQDVLVTEERSRRTGKGEGGWCVCVCVCVCVCGVGGGMQMISCKHAGV